MTILLIQPWFTAIGHPAQSLLNLAEALRHDDRLEYLVSFQKKSKFFQESYRRLSALGQATYFTVDTQVGASNTARSLLWLLINRLQGKRYHRIFFLDESLLTLALLWPIISTLYPVDRLGVLHLFGPESIVKRRIANFLVGNFIKRREVKMYLRTEEMASAWREAYPEILYHKIEVLPSLEIPDEPCVKRTKVHQEEIAFGIIGQIRIGKSIEWLVPLFEQNVSLGRLTVAGEFNTQDTEKQLSVLSRFEGFRHCFMTEEELLKAVVQQDYLLMLYDHWDKRMESAVLYLAARANCPVIVYGDSWCGRMVREFGCGIIAPSERKNAAEFLAAVPRPGSEAYDALVTGILAFRQAYSSQTLRGRVIKEFFGE